jgi:hypothetical protein
MEKSKKKKHYDSLPNDALPIPNYPTYYATPSGEIWRISKSRKVRYGVVESRIIKLKDRFNSKIGYCQIQPFVDGKKVLRYTHRLILLAFKGECPEGYECDHIDRNTANNCLDNLRWLSREENMERRLNGFPNYDNGRKKHKNYDSKYSHIKNDVIKMINEGFDKKTIAIKFNIPEYQVVTFGWRKPIWTFERVQQLAILCKTKSEFSIKYSTAYHNARNNGWIKLLSFKLVD